MVETELETQTRLKRASQAVIAQISADPQTAARSREAAFWDERIDPATSKICGLELSRKLGAISTCANTLEFRRYDDLIELHNANFCRNPAACPVCAKRLQRRRVARFHDPIRRAASDFEYVYLLTFTVPGMEDLEAQINLLNDGMRRFRLMGQKRDLFRGLGEWGKVEGAVSTIEVKRGRGSGKWHTHCHSLIFCRSPIDFAAREEIEFQGKRVRASKLSREWNESTGGAAIGVDCEPIRTKRVFRNGELVDLDAWDQALEVFKYNSKLISREAPADLAQILCSSYGRRMFRTYGVFRDQESQYYAGPLEPYVSERPEGYENIKPEILMSRWTGDRYTALRPAPGPLFDDSDLSGERKERFAGFARLNGFFRKTKYDVIRNRGYYKRRGRLRDFLKDLEAVESQRLSALAEFRSAWELDSFDKLAEKFGWNETPFLIRQAMERAEADRAAIEGPIPPYARPALMSAWVEHFISGVASPAPPE